ncbi:unnamed protein product [Lupinus luteus]|uniref:Uncharacterized protein n=1 Tax=Lupinus luteus TaxID=3873 RepID=A0AAV1XMJ2_LUPLU
MSSNLNKSYLLVKTLGWGRDMASSSIEAPLTPLVRQEVAAGVEVQITEPTEQVSTGNGKESNSWSTNREQHSNSSSIETLNRPIEIERGSCCRFKGGVSSSYGDERAASSDVSLARNFPSGDHCGSRRAYRDDHSGGRGKA